MDNQELLQAIETMMDKKLDAKLAPINERLARIEEHTDRIEERTTKTEIILENDIHKQLKLLGEGQQMVIEKFHQLDALTEKVDDIQTTVEVLKALSVKK